VKASSVQLRALPVPTGRKLTSHARIGLPSFVAGRLPVLVSRSYHTSLSRTRPFSPKLKKTASCRYQVSAKREPQDLTAELDRAVRLVVCMRTFTNNLTTQAGVAQWPEQMIRNHQVVGSTPILGSNKTKDLGKKPESFFIV
jgi:hypothetical protein